MRDIYQRGMTQEVFGWTAASNNQAYISGRLSLALNAISIARTLEGPPWVTTAANRRAEREHVHRADPSRAVARMGLEHVMGVYVIWKFARNKAMAKKFLVDAQTNYRPHFANSGFYNFPAWENGVRGGFRAMRRAAAADRARPRGKYTVLTTIAQRYTANVGHPGFANAAVDEVFNKFLDPADVRRGGAGQDDRGRGCVDVRRPGAVDLPEVEESGEGLRCTTRPRSRSTSRT